METINELSNYIPRACDCGFCLKHGASYISDNQGRLTINLNDKSNCNQYRQGNEIADFLLCKICGVLVGVCYEEDRHLYAAINSKAIDKNSDLKAEKIVSPKTLSNNQKIQRWKNAWFTEVSIDSK